MSYRIARRARTTPVDFLWVKPSASVSSWWRRRPAAAVLVDSARCIGALKKEVDSWKGSRSLFREN
jgi:hypothetical protein